MWHDCHHISSVCDHLCKHVGWWQLKNPVPPPPFIAVLHSANSASFTRPRPPKTWPLLSKHLGWISVEGLQSKTSKEHDICDCVIHTSMHHTRHTHTHVLLRSCPCNRAYINYLANRPPSNHSPINKEWPCNSSTNKINKKKDMSYFDAICDNDWFRWTGFGCRVPAP